MEKGNEGDGIILFAFRQIEWYVDNKQMYRKFYYAWNCSAIPDSVVAIGQIAADTLVEIIARSLWLISNGETKVTSLVCYRKD